jgi:hypothetical protein
MNLLCIDYYVYTSCQKQNCSNLNLLKFVTWSVGQSLEYNFGIVHIAMESIQRNFLVYLEDNLYQYTKTTCFLALNINPWRKRSSFWGYILQEGRSLYCNLCLLPLDIYISTLFLKSSQFPWKYIVVVAVWCKFPIHLHMDTNWKLKHFQSLELK